MVKVIEEIVDDGIFMELFNSYAENIVIGFQKVRQLVWSQTNPKYWLDVWILSLNQGSEIYQNM